MPRPVPLPLRQLLASLCHDGLDGAAIARQLHLPARTVQHLLRQFRRHGGEPSPPQYRPAQRTQPPDDPVIQQALLLHEAHPTWGAGFIRVRLAQLHPGLPLPSARTLQRWWRLAPQPPAVAGRKPPRERQAARQPHDVWQMDAVEQLPLAEGQLVSWLRWVDEFSGAVLGTVVFPQGYWGHVPATAVQDQLRRQFRCWGVPNALRVDNGNPWGNWSDLPTALALWLVGLGVDVRWNDPRCPQQNGKVERSQGTGKRWAEPGRCHTAEELQAHLDEVDQIQRACYPAVGGSSRLAAFPQLRHSGRRYTQAWEKNTWDLGRVRQHMAGYLVPRVVHSGRVTLYDQRYYVGRAYNGQTLYVHLDPDAGLWVIADNEGRQLRQHEAREITRTRIVKLDLHDPH